MRKVHLLLLLVLAFTAGCATQRPKGRVGLLKNVRTTAYTQTEPGGSNSACGRPLRSSLVHSAAADWSRYPVGTRFQIISTGEICEIDDYGSALVGTDTIDLFKN
ncbi:MAG: hypothetical protein QOD99_69, partial [Chthoniobacter sp.]|nr:hypothetical protein [Chthoniobacter sp.]